MLLALLIVIGASGCSTKAATAQPAATSELVTAAPAATSTAASVLPQMGPGGPGGGGSFASAAPTYSDLAYATVSAAQKLDLNIPTAGSPLPDPERFRGLQHPAHSR